MKIENRKIGLIAGNGKFPLIFAQEAKRVGAEVVALAIKKETSPRLQNLVDRIHWVNVGQLGDLIEICKKEGITRAVMAGQVRHTRLFSQVKLDARAMALLAGVKDKKANSLLGAVADELLREGIELMDSATYLSHLLPSPGILTRRKPTQREWRDIEFGHKMAKEIAGLDIGQTVVVKDQAVLAVEGMEGTDRTIKRGGRLGRGDVVVVKVSKPEQDRRFDLPIVGERTVEVLKQAKAKVLAFSARNTILLDREKVVKSANQNGISLVAIKEKES
ncbi:UDP-2,3-diacylglucosamine diphosphatase LpxI [bacterium]|nr:UDP-2,3-diacylglucosamine diphosphatase LpxI [bacterium]NIN92574.1 UDP-2,3-diacylglucosamine diphosphatase LpxI [bacterium]NIO18616.1 UDP-2,3-diacylglucosamine diphosphatase LpxI [bacterium]NIO73631.1 UDP-2,3-diacylglucosamine diphosphatase LpxI [bacterium]